MPTVRQFPVSALIGTQAVISDLPTTRELSVTWPLQARNQQDYASALRGAAVKRLRQTNEV